MRKETRRSVQARQQRVRQRRARRWRRVAVRLLLLALPVLFWSTVFAAQSGARLPSQVADALPDAAQLLIAVACLFLIALRLSTSIIFKLPESFELLFTEGEKQT